MKTHLLSIEGKKIKDLDVPLCFNEKIREDIISKVIEVVKEMQPYGLDPRAGRRHSASGILSHMRHKWKTTYGHGISRVPRKIMWRRGDQFYWIGAEVASTRGGRRAHPHKVDLAGRKINKKEYALALRSVLASTASSDLIKRKYASLNDVKIENTLPIVVEEKMLKLNAKQFYEALKKILGVLYSVSYITKDVRAGKGRHRNRKYKSNAGMLFIIGKDEDVKISGIEVKRASDLKVEDLGRGNIGRVTMFSEKAVKLIELENTLVFEVDDKNKTELKRDFEKMFKVKVEKIRTHSRNNKKIAYIKLKKENPAIDVATKLGLI